MIYQFSNRSNRAIVAALARSLDHIQAGLREVFQVLHHTHYSAPWEKTSTCEGR